MIPPDVRHVHAYIEAREALDRLAAAYGASDALMSHRTSGYVLLSFADSIAEDQFFESPDATHEVVNGSDGAYLRAAYRLGKIEICAMRRITRTPGAS